MGANGGDGGNGGNGKDGGDSTVGAIGGVAGVLGVGGPSKTWIIIVYIKAPEVVVQEVIGRLISNGDGDVGAVPVEKGF